MILGMILRLDYVRVIYNILNGFLNINMRVFYFFEIINKFL